MNIGSTLYYNQIPGPNISSPSTSGSACHLLNLLIPLVSPPTIAWDLLASGCFCCKHQKKRDLNKTHRSVFSQISRIWRLLVLFFGVFFFFLRQFNLSFSGLSLVFLRCWWALALCLYWRLWHCMASWESLRALGLIVEEGKDTCHHFCPF